MGGNKASRAVLVQIEVHGAVERVVVSWHTHDSSDEADPGADWT